ncbi:MAG: hypothetical protein OEV44_01110 [Spirochaetota bacterium]|nr:hypothetical protein [Spirochaetota bacterium]
MDIKDELAELPSDGEKLEDIEKEEEIETSEDSQSEKKEEEEKELPFHEHPRFKELIEEKNSANERADKTSRELEKLREETESKFSELKESQSKTTTIPNWFTELYGENEVAYAKYQEQDKATREDIKREIREEFKREEEEKKNSIKKWENRIEEQLKELEDSGEKFDKNELKKLMEENPTYTQDGEFNFREKLELLKLRNSKDPKKVKARKEIVDDDGKSKAEPADKKWFTPADMKGKGWDGLL